MNERRLVKMDRKSINRILIFKTLIIGKIQKYDPESLLI